MLMVNEAAAAGQSAVVTLSFPVGARPTAMGEAFTGLANDANAIFYNPAGLGQSPLTLSWKTHMGDSAFTALAARSASEFGVREYVWGGSDRGIMRFNGKIWEKGEVYLPEEGESIRSVAQRYFATDDREIIDQAIWEIRKENKLGMVRYGALVAMLYENDHGLSNAVSELIHNEETKKKAEAARIAGEARKAEEAKIAADDDAEGAEDTQAADDTGNHGGIQNSEEEAALNDQPALTAIDDAPAVNIPPFNSEEFAKMLILLTPNEAVVSHISEKILPHTMPADARKQLAEKIVTILETEDRGIDQVTELSIPFTIAIRGSVTALHLDASERLWVGTANDGLWVYHQSRWRRVSTGAEKSVTSISVAPNGTAAVGTAQGLAVITNASSSDAPAFFTDENGLPDSYVTSVAHIGNDQLYIGTPRGLVRKTGDEFTVFDTSSGLLSTAVTALFADSKARLWAGGENGIAIYSPGARSWMRYRFPGSVVYSFAEQSNGTMWIGTNRGVITHKAGKPVTGSDGRPVSTPEWKTYHSKNALKNDNIRAVAACGRDMWVATDGAMHQYANAETQVLLFYEQLLPAFKMPDLWHAFPAIVIPTEDWGTIGFSMNFINLGDNERWSEVEEYLGRSRSWEGVFGLSYGVPIKEDLSFGINAKYVCSALDPAEGGIGHTFAIDAGILKRNLFIDRFDAGFMLQNMGPSIYYLTPEEADPIPFSLRLGLAYKPVQTPFHELTLVADAYREVVKTYYDKKPDPFWAALWTGMLNNEESTFKEQVQEINVSLGAEYTYADFMALRLGFMGDYLGERYELTLGLGVKYANLNFDFSYIYSPPGFMGGILRTINEEKEGATGARNGQWRISFLFGL